MKDRRRAIHSELIEESKTSPGYFKYKITIKEIDGKVHSVPAYGVDMQDAIKRLLKDEKSSKINKIYVKKIEPKLIAFIFIAWFSSIVTSAVINDYKMAYIAVISMFGLVTIYAAVNFIKSMKQ
jgi:hypothetical protein